MTERDDKPKSDAAAMADAINRELQGAFRPVVEHAGEARNIAEELARVADRTARQAEALRADDDAGSRELMTELVAMSDMLRSLAGQLQVMTQRSVQDLDQLKGRLIQAVHVSALGNRRRHERIEVDMPAEASFAGRSEPARLVNLSLGGAKMDLPISRGVGTVVALRVAGLTHELKAEVVKTTEDGTQLRFAIEDAAAEELRRFLERVGSTKPDQSN
jgi:hypothetical protein